MYKRQGNGGSAADAEHIVGELMKGFRLARKVNPAYARKLVEADPELGAVLAQNLQGALPAIALDGHLALSTAYMNAVSYTHLDVYKRQDAHSSGARCVHMKEAWRLLKKEFGASYANELTDGHLLFDVPAE